MRLNTFILAVEARGGKVEVFQHDAGMNVYVRIAVKGRTYFFRSSHDWGDRLTAWERVANMMADKGIAPNDNFPEVQHI